MSTFEVSVYKLKIEPHFNADTLELAKVGDYVSVVKKGSFKTGDLGVYIPEGAIVPDWLLQKMGLWKTDPACVGKGMLAGAAGNRVRAQNFRKVLSQGLVYKVVESVPEKSIGHAIEYYGSNGTTDGWHHYAVDEGDNVANILGIIKYIPIIPVHMSGEVFNAFGNTINYDIENIKKYPHILIEGENVVITEKAHGTFCCIGFHPDYVYPIIHSKGLGEQGLIFRLVKEHTTFYNKLKHKFLTTVSCFKDINYYNEVNLNNLYVKTYRNSDFFIQVFENLWVNDCQTPLYFLGEIFGKGVQDLTYGQAPSFKLFDIYEGQPGQGRYLNFDDKEAFCANFDIPMVPVLYKGPYTKERVLQLTDGKEMVSGKGLHLREGVVVTTLEERRCDEIGRVILKSVSEAYLLRKGDHVTELQ